MPKLVQIKPLKDYKLYCKYSDSTQGEISINHLLQKKGYKQLENTHFFKEAMIDPATNDICWGKDLRLCRNAIYKQISLINMMKRFHINIDKI